MVWIVLSSLLLIIGIGAGVVFANAETSSGKVGSKGFTAAFGVAAILWLAVSFFFSVHIVDTRNVGVVKTLGSITGQVGEGVQLTWPWQTVEEWHIRVQVIEPDTRCSNGTPACMDAGSIDIQDVYINGALNIEVDTKDVQELARNVGQGYSGYDCPQPPLPGREESDCKLPGR